ncbi:unnamed protein product [Prunus armeniaca]|uniref:Uncharacterized protein n=1 Tax=Prunus armeniaca TaxID=36596 RepID=A0A6J5VWL0_PRUAR|nr:unnamed protein product [Prunus armeniaca]
MRQLPENKLDKKLKGIHAWRKVFSMIFVAICASVWICSAVAAAPAAASSIPVASMGKWIDC